MKIFHGCYKFFIEPSMAIINVILEVYGQKAVLTKRELCSEWVPSEWESKQLIETLQ